MIHPSREFRDTHPAVRGIFRGMKMGKREIKCRIDEGKNTVTWSAEGEADLVLNAERCSDKVRAYAALHGMKQRIGDAAALDKGAEVGEKFAAMRALVDYYETGAEDWNRAGRGGGGFRVNEDLVVTCIAALFFAGDEGKADRQVEKYAAKHGGTRAEAIKVFYDTVEVRSEYARRAAERSTKVSAVDLLDGIDEA